MVLPPPEAWFSAGIAQLFWPTRPVVLETEHYGSSKRRNAFTKELLLQSVEDYHASYLSIHYWPHEFLEEMKDAVDAVNMRMGYRLHISKCEWPTQVKLGDTFEISYVLANAGVSPCYRGGFPCFTLKNDKEGIVSVLVDTKTDVKKLPPGKPGELQEQKIVSRFTISPTYTVGEEIFYRSAAAGAYKLYFSVGAADGTPIFELPYPNEDGRKRYRLGIITVKDRTSPEHS
jgi:hypothetical protein